MNDKDQPQPAAAPCPKTCHCGGDGTLMCAPDSTRIWYTSYHPPDGGRILPCPWRTTREAEARAEKADTEYADAIERLATENAALRGALLDLTASHDKRDPPCRCEGCEVLRSAGSPAHDSGSARGAGADGRR